MHTRKMCRVNLHRKWILHKNSEIQQTNQQSIPPSNIEMKYIAYYRVSTRVQADSHLGLEAQRETVLSYIRNNGNQLIAEYTEVESGRNNSRPVLLQAIQQTKQEDATLVIARLDRLSRSVTLVSTLMDTQVRFVCCDMPFADETTIYLIAALAQREVRLISERTKSALQAKTAREPDWKEKRPYYDNIGDEGRRRGALRTKEIADNDPSNLAAYEFIARRRERGMSYQQIADELNKRGIKGRRGKQFYKMSVRKLYLRFASQDDKI